ncbi:hypothetical protein PRIPAC_78279 [Pristionchus pacificus]|nr:hypothetical protein PRIPAC_78279 [Pristionchus pacificus]
MLGCDCYCLNSFVYLVGFLTIASKVIPFLFKLVKGEKLIELQEKNYKKDVVYFYQFPGTPTVSSFSPFCIKVEAFLRLHKIKYERRNTLSTRGSNGQLPFIELNGEIHSDSQIIIRRLTQIFKLKEYPDEQTAAIGHAVDRLLDNHTFNLRLMIKTGVDKMIREMNSDTVHPVFLPIVASLGGWYLSNKMVNRASVSVGKFKEYEFKELLRNDLIQLQTILGKKNFLMGEEPTTVDCTAIGQLGSANAIPSSRYYYHDLLDSSELAPLKEYCERVKTRIFGDEFCDRK